MATSINFFSSLRNKLIFLFLTTSLIPFITVGLFIYLYAQHTLESEVINKLIAVRDIKAHQIENYVTERLADLTVTVNNPFMVNTFKAFEKALHQDVTRLTDRNITNITETEVIETLRTTYLHRPNLTDSNDGSTYTTAHARYHPIFKRYLENYNYYDILLVELHEGLVIYSTKKENDFGTSLTDGTYASTHLGEIFKRVVSASNADFTTLVDFAYYEPSKSPIAFIAAPIFEKSKIIGVFILQLSTQQIDNIMQIRSGLGKTGESILVSADDFLLRSSSRFSAQDSVLKIKADSQDSRAAASGEIGVKKTVDYRGEETIVVYAPLNIPGVRWLLDVKIDTSEAFAPVRKLFFWMILVLGLGVVTVSAIALLMSNFITYPIYKVTKIARQLAAGDMSPTDFTTNGRDELAMMAEAFRQMTANQRQIIGDIVRVSQGLAEGDLQITYLAHYQGDLAQIEQAIDSALFNLRLQVVDIVKITQGLAEGRVDLTPQAQYKGEFIKIKQALETTTQKLSEVTTKNATQDWLKTGQTQLNEKLRGEQEIITLVKNTIDFIASYTGIQVGLLYLVQENERQTPYLQKVASHAYTAKDHMPDTFLIGEGLVGQVALEKKPLLRSFIPNEHNLIVQSSLVQIAPRFVLFMPFLYEEIVKGVVELGSEEPFTDIQREFLEQAMLSIGIAINSAESREHLQALLEYSQIQAKELKTQQATLQQTNEELQVQTEELQTQQEELRQSNDELAVRTKELEQQKQDIHDKNVSLEETRQLMEIKAKELELASQYKSEFLANMSHELRTPLNSLLILAQILAENKQGNLTDKQLEYVSTIYSAGSDLLDLINDILDLSKIEAGKVETITEAVHVADMIQSTTQKFYPLAQNKGLIFECQVTENVPPVLFTDEQRLKQIINNLLSNALKFTAEGSVKLSMYRPESKEVTAVGLQATKMLAVKVVDTGVGIPKEKQQIIFEAFQQANGTTSRRYGGTGLGLSISRQLARLLGGDLLVSSAEGQGSTFNLYIAEGEESAVRQSDVQSSTYTAIFKQNPEKLPSSPTKVEATLNDDRQDLQPEDKVILIIEDDHKLSNILMELAQEKDFKCLRAETGETGLQTAQQYKPDAIVLDIGLPGMDGWAVMERLKSDPQTRHIPVHFISAAEQSVNAKRMGAIGYSLKPVNITEVGETFKRIAQFLAKTTKQVLAMVEEVSLQQKIQEWIANDSTTLCFTTTIEEATAHLQATSFDCIIIDIDVAQTMSLDFLNYLQNNRAFSQIPTIIYATRPLTPEETAILERYADNLPIKTVQSHERLLNEVTLFLHQVATQLPNEKSVVRRSMYEKEATLVDKRVLVVDDDSRNVFALTVALDERGMLVSNCENGQQALDFLAEQPEVDVVLMDIMMPGMDGYETIRQIRLQPRFHKLPIIALTAKAMKGDKAKCIEAGANDYLAKPVDTEQLISLMRVWLYNT